MDGSGCTEDDNLFVVVVGHVLIFACSLFFFAVIL